MPEKSNKNKNRWDRGIDFKRNIFIMLTVIGLAIIGFIIFEITLENERPNHSGENLTVNWMDVHGVGLYPSDNGNLNSLYLATHHGLFKKDLGDNSSSNTSGWMQVGNDKSDLMGFVIDPSNKGVMYSSGHPPTGGNLGFRISEDYGETWQKVSDVTTPKPIDFHTMTVGNDPEIIYASNGMGDNIFISADGGKNWTNTSPPAGGHQVITLAANQSNSNNVYAATTGGIYTSIDQGKNWQKINNELVNANNTMVTGIGTAPDSKAAYAFVAPSQTDDENNPGYIIKSIDGAKTWTKTEGQINGVVFASKFAFGNNGEIYTAVIQDSPQTGVAASVFSSDDNGKTWILEGTNNKSLAEA